ncbi:TraE/TraK family type IV conjugative transfer system protein [Acinetobacter sp. P1(2025)]|uniref:TraE/TraK family type IV conjugative transfer system protein n=1 Tax=Acinetobacter sp. P1(2025) TaxID=3446120 RepID=UPI003F52FB21
MKYSLFNRDWNTTHKVAIGALFSTFVLSIVVLVQAITISTKSERIIIAPPIIDQEYQIQKDSANVEYYQAMAAVFSNIIGQTTPKNIENTRKTINQFLSPALQRQMDESLVALANKLPKENFTSWFVLKNMFYEKQTGKIFAQGMLQSSMVGSRVLEQPVVYEYIIKMNAGKPMVVHFNSYDGNKPRTLAYIRAEQAQQQMQKQPQQQQSSN